MRLFKLLAPILKRYESMAEKVLGATKVSTKGQVTIPVEAREKFGIEIGDLILFIQDGEKLVIRKG
jgi:AbrB family looped-hinge helix DNA binding protein